MLPRPESRKTPRRPMRRNAEGLIGLDQRRLSCVISDMSEGGARLLIAGATADLPHSFTLLLSRDASARRQCEIVWRDGETVGVKFTT